MNFKRLMAGLCLWGIISLVHAELLRTLKSPDGNVAVKIATKEHLKYSVTFHGKTVVEASDLGVMLYGNDLGQGATLAGKTKTVEINESYPVLGGTPRRSIVAFLRLFP